MAQEQSGSNKAIAAVMAGSGMIIVTWALHQYGHVTLPEEVEQAAQTLVTTALVWLVPHGSEPQ